MSFSDIKDQDTALRVLRNMVTRNRIPNALLFWGPSGVGKHLTAFEMAKAINCETAQADSCGQCLPCRKVASGNHPDISTVTPLRKSRIIDVEAINAIIELASLRPYESKWRIFIIQEAERMRDPAQNHLLKTLEEPPGNSLFILISEFPQWLLPTIRSRCQRLRFGALKPKTVTGILARERNVAPDLAESIAAISQGRMTRAFDLVDSDKRVVVFDVISRITQGEDPLALAEEFARYIASQKAQIEASIKAQSQPIEKNEFSKEDQERIQEEQTALVDALARRDIMEYLYLMETWYRDKLVFSATGDAAHVFNRDQMALLETAEVSQPENKIGAIEKARLYLERFLNEERVFRDLFFALAQ